MCAILIFKIIFYDIVDISILIDMQNKLKIINEHNKIFDHFLDR